MTALEREKLGEWLSAYVDGELNAEQNALIERLIEEDGEVRRRLEEMRSVSQMVADLPRHAAPPSILQDICRQTEREALLGDAEEDLVFVPGQARFGMRLLAPAAMVVMVVTVAIVVYRVLPGRPLLPDTLVVSNTPKDAAPAGGLGDDSSPAEASSKMGAAAGAPGQKLADASSKKQADLATLEQKITRLAPTEDLVNHLFANEANTLTLTYATTQDRDRSLSALTERLRAASIDELATGGSLSDSPQGGVFIEGREGVNYLSSQDRQVLVRLPKNQIESLVRLEVDSRAGSDIRMQVGPIDVRGPDQANMLANVISQNEFAAPQENPPGEPPDSPAPVGFGEEAKVLGKLFASLTDQDEMPTPDYAFEAIDSDGHATSGDSATASKNGVSLPDAARSAGAPEENESTEDQAAPKRRRFARSGRREGRTDQGADAPLQEPSAEAEDADTLAAEEEATKTKTVRPEEKQKGDSESDSDDEKSAVWPVLPDRPTLAERRLADARRKVAAAPKQVAIKRAVPVDSGSEAFVTLVIQLVSREPVLPKPPRDTAKPVPHKARRAPAKKGKATDGVPNH